MGDWPDAGGLIRYQVVLRADTTFGGGRYRRARPGKLVALARSIEEHGLLLPPAAIEVGSTPGTEGMSLVNGRPIVLLGGERRFMSLGKGSTMPAALVKDWPGFIAWMEMDAAIRDRMSTQVGVVRPPTLADADGFRTRALTYLGDRRPYTRRPREAMAAYFGTDTDQMRCYQALRATALGEQTPERQAFAQRILPAVDAGELKPSSGLSRVVQDHARALLNGKSATEQRNTLAGALMQLEIAAREVDELGTIAPDFPQDELASFVDRLEKVRARIVRGTRNVREGEHRGPGD